MATCRLNICDELSGSTTFNRQTGTPFSILTRIVRPCVPNVASSLSVQHFASSADTICDSKDGAVDVGMLDGELKLPTVGDAMGVDLTLIGGGASGGTDIVHTSLRGIRRVDGVRWEGDLAIGHGGC